MNSVIHIHNDDQNKDNLFYNKKVSDYTVNDFLITNIANVNRHLFKDFEQIFYFNESILSDDFLLHILNFLKQMGYKQVSIKNTSIRYDDTKLKPIDDLIEQLTIVNHIV